MASEGRQLPNSNIKRNKALTDAKAKNDALVLAGGTYLSSGTETRLNDDQPIYDNAMNRVARKKSDEIAATATLNSTAEKIRRKISRFIRVYKLAVEDGVYAPSTYALYHLDLSGNVPDLDAYSDIKTVAANLITGEAARVAAGGVAMANPAISEVIALNTTFLTDFGAQSAAITAITQAEQDLDALNEGVDETILFVYNEVETHFSNRSNSAIRVQGKTWGINYVKTGGEKKVSGTVTDSDDHTSIIDAEIRFDNGKNTADSTIVGYELNTTLMDEQLLIAEHPLYITLETPVTLVEGENPVVNLLMIKKP